MKRRVYLCINYKQSKFKAMTTSTVKHPIKPGDKFTVIGGTEIFTVQSFIGNQNCQPREYAHEAYEDNNDNPKFTVITTTGSGAIWTETVLVNHEQ